MSVVGIAYVCDDAGEPWAEHESCVAEVQRTDEDEIRVGIELRAGDGDVATLYVTVEQASRLSHLISLAVLANEAAAHEAAQL